MSRISTNVNSLLAQRVLSQNNKSLTKSLERLSTGLAINRGADNPAGLIASEKLRSEKASISAAISNAERADQVLNVAEGGLQELNGILLEVQTLVNQSANEAGLSADERAANQLQVDSLLQTIDRIASATSFEGVKLLNGSYDFDITSQNANVVDLAVRGAKLEHGTTRDVNVVITNSAQHGSLFLSVGANLDLTTSTSAFEFEIAGAKGSRQFAFASGTSLAYVASAINTYKAITGVSAVASGAYLELKSAELGSDQFVSFKLTNQGGQSGRVLLASSTNENAFTTTGATNFSSFTNPIRDAGADVGATINGIAATSRGRTISVDTDYLNLSLTLNAGGSQTAGTFNAFTISGGGAKFNLGPGVDILNQVSVGIRNVAARNLGDSTVGHLDSLASGRANNLVDGNLGNASQVVNLAIDQVSQLRGRLGAFQKNVVGATIRSLGIALENTSSAESSIRDTDFATETAALTRSQILVNASTNILQIANNQPQSVLQLLRQG